jgi:hypothetical protein
MSVTVWLTRQHKVKTFQFNSKKAYRAWLKRYHEMVDVMEVSA